MPDQPFEGGHYTGPKRHESGRRLSYTTRREQQQRAAWERRSDPVRQILVLWRSLPDYRRAEVMVALRLIPDPDASGDRLG